MTYGNVHRFFLRTIASRGVLPYADAQRVLDQSFPDKENASLEDLTKEINEKIRSFDQEIKVVIDEVTAEKKFVFLSRAFDDATKAQNVFSPQELDFFRVLIEEIMTTESRQITSQYALNLVNRLKLSKSDAQKLLNTWCRMYYLEQTNSNYALGIRAIHEFEGYLRENMPDAIQECCLCREIVYRGYNCFSCGQAAVHSRCLATYVQNVSKWPCCGANYDPSQLEQLDREGLLSQTQLLERTQTQLLERTQTQPLEQTQTQTSSRLNSTHSQREETMELSDEDFDLSMGTPIPGVSQRISRKRKRT